MKTEQKEKLMNDAYDLRYHTIEFNIYIEGLPEPDENVDMANDEYDEKHIDIALALYNGYTDVRLETIEEMLEDMEEPTLELNIFKKEGQTLCSYEWFMGDNIMGLIINLDTLELVGENHDTNYSCKNAQIAEILSGRKNMAYEDPEYDEEFTKILEQ